MQALFFKVTRCRPCKALHAFLGGVGFEGCRVHGDTQIVHHCKVSLSKAGNACQCVLSGQAKDRGNVGGALHSLTGHVEGLHLAEARALEHCAHFVCNLHVLGRRRSHILVRLAGGFLEGFGKHAENGLSAAEILLKVCTLAQSVLYDFADSNTDGGTGRGCNGYSAFFELFHKAATDFVALVLYGGAQLLPQLRHKVAGCGYNLNITGRHVDAVF